LTVLKNTHKKQEQEVDG